MMLLPFVGLMVAHIQGTSPDEAGFVSGVLVGVFQGAQVFSGKMWGSVSDKFGRKPVMLIGLALSGVVMIMFGLSNTVMMAAIARFLHGLVNGNVIVAKTVVGEVTDKTNEAKGFATISFCWGVGSLVGPAFGGLLYDPCRASHLPFAISCDGIYGKYPALFPCVIGAVYSLFAFVVGLIAMEETNPRAKPLSHAFPCFRSAREHIAHRIPTHDEHNDEHSDIDLEAANAPHEAAAGAAPSDSATQKKSEDGVPPGAFAVDASLALSEEELALQAHNSAASLTICAIAADRGMRTAILFYVLIAAGDIIWWETFPLWAIASTAVGGMAASAHTIGLLIMMTFVPVMMANLTFHIVCEAMDRVSLWRLLMASWAVSAVLVPVTTSWLPEAAVLPVVGALLFIRQWIESWAYSLVFLFISRVSPRAHLGAMNGAAQGSASVVRTILPMLAAPIFAFSIKDATRPFPLNHYLVYLLQAIFYCMAIFYSIGFSVRSEPPRGINPVTKQATDLADDDEAFDPTHRALPKVTSGDNEAD